MCESGNEITNQSFKDTFFSTNVKVLNKQDPKLIKTFTCESGNEINKPGS